MARLSKEEINIKLKPKGFKIVGEYVNNKIKTEFECNNGHKWSTRPDYVIGGGGCPYCSGKLFTKDIINKNIMPRGIALIGEYTDTMTKTEFSCVNGHNWSTTPNSVLMNNGCPTCAGKKRLSKDIINERLAKNDRNIIIIGDYINNYTKAEFECDNGHKWLGRADQILRGVGCPKCTDYGFNISKPGYIYILDFTTHIKYGITNNLNNRLNDHKRNGNYTLVLSKLYEDGSIARNWEKNIKIIFGGRFVSKEIMPDGYTETLSPDKLEALLNTIQ